MIGPQEVVLADDKVASMLEKLTAMKAKLAELKQREAEVLASPHNQVSLTDPDARSMATSHDVGMVGYNVQSAVDTEHHLIVSHEVTNIVSDRVLLSRQAAKAKIAMGSKDARCLCRPRLLQRRRNHGLQSQWRHGLCAQTIDVRLTGCGSFWQG